MQIVLNNVKHVHNLYIHNKQWDTTHSFLKTILLDYTLTKDIKWKTILELRNSGVAHVEILHFGTLALSINKILITDSS